MTQTELTVQHVETLLEVLILDGKIEGVCMGPHHRTGSSGNLTVPPTDPGI